MKKLFVCTLGVLLLFGCVSKKNHEVVELGQTDFDGMKITFYKDVVDYGTGDSLIATAHSLYFCTDENSLQYSTAPYLVSKDKTTKFYADLYGNYEIYDENDNIVPYLEAINYEDDKVIYVYLLDNKKKYYEKNKHLAADISILGCVSSATGSSSTCSKEYNCSYEAIMNEIDKWEKIDTYKDYADFKDFRMFMDIRFNKNEIGGFQKTISFYNVELENGNWLIKIDQGHSDYYLLKHKEVESLKNILK